MPSEMFVSTKKTAVVNISIASEYSLYIRMTGVAFLDVGKGTLKLILASHRYLATEWSLFRSLRDNKRPHRLLRESTRKGNSCPSQHAR